MPFSAIRQRYVLPWVTIGVNTNLVSGQGYVCDSGGPLTLTLPNAVQGATISVYNVAGGFIVTAQPGDFIRVSNVISSGGGTASSNDDGDSLLLVYEQANNLWMCTSASGTISVV